MIKILILHKINNKTNENFHIFTINKHDNLLLRSASCRANISRISRTQQSLSSSDLACNEKENRCLKYY